jgi:regulator of sigma E protease
MPGDVILAVEGQPSPGVEGFGAFIRALPQERSFDWTVLRDGVETVVDAPNPFPPIVSAVTPQSAALAAGLRQGDVILAVDGEELWTFDQLRERVEASGGETLNLTIWRDGTEMPVALAPKRMDLPLEEGGFETRWLIGVNGGLFFTPETETPGIGEALQHGVDQTIFVCGPRCRAFITWRSARSRPATSAGPSASPRRAARRRARAGSASSGSSRCCRRRWG